MRRLFCPVAVAAAYINGRLNMFMITHIGNDVDISFRLCVPSMISHQRYIAIRNQWQIQRALANHGEIQQKPSIISLHVIRQ